MDANEDKSNMYIETKIHRKIKKLSKKIKFFFFLASQQKKNYNICCFQIFVDGKELN